jgi:predicted nucleic acid-binding protein
MAVIIADAGPLIALAKIDHLTILQQLFGQVAITEAIKAEILTAQSNDARLIQAALAKGWLQCVADPQLKTVVSRSLGLGEKTAIEYALQSKQDVLLIMDDALARKKALHYQLNIIGTCMLIYSAENKKLINNADELMTELQQKGYRISAKVIALVKAQMPS